jgi:hypothetical protein
MPCLPPPRVLGAGDDHGVRRVEQNVVERDFELVNERQVPSLLVGVLVVKKSVFNIKLGG